MRKTDLFVEAIALSSPAEFFIKYIVEIGNKQNAKHEENLL